MASLARPAKAPQVFCSACNHTLRVRSFTSAASQYGQAAKGANMSIKQVVGKMGPMKSLKSEMQKATRSQLPDDFGLMPQTFVLPKSADLPKIWNEPMRALKIFYNVQYMKLQRYFGTLYFFRWQVKSDPLTGRRMKTPMDMAKRKPMARELHRKFYKAVAEGDINTLDKVARGGLKAKMRTKIENSKKDNKGRQTWEVQYIGRTWTEKLWWPFSTMLNSYSTRVLSDLAASLEIPDSMIRQMVVQLTTRQRVVEDGKPVEFKEITENLVLQKLKIRGEWDDWKLWGTLPPSTLPQIENIFKGTNAATGTSIMDKLTTSPAAAAFMGGRGSNV